MPSFDPLYASSPVHAAPAQATDQVSLDKCFLQHQPMSFSQPASERAHFFRTFSVAGRKRSRDEASVNLDPPERMVDRYGVNESENEQFYGPVITLIKKSAGYIPEVNSQSGTYLEERAADGEARKAEAARLAQAQSAQSRPSLRGHKSQRLDMTSEKSSSCGSNPTREAADRMTASPDSLAQPVVDEFTIRLGIGWRRVSDDRYIQAAARGWARYIENHYPLTNVKVYLESRSLEAYLVEATEGFFLFAKNLRQGRLVSATAEGAIPNLLVWPPVFDGPETIHASDPPSPQPLVSDKLVEAVGQVFLAAKKMDLS
ncbi:hypothetical protein N657DRAFT_646244 [Parathielavia appendiculata]|uniref:Uncharacterized protein n=1 Tax=Parathielavia appendiculata TaxID=2587402 RepID=A0AAN6TYL0_9PEZI|nr:hypothetical protein N657DRAFT_646244 [Parathielavia appendiculata]